MIDWSCLSFLVFGTGTFGVDPDESTAFRMLDLYRERGGNVIDTARCYPPTHQGRSEAIVGRWLKSRACRDEFLISSKGGHPPMDQLGQPRLSREELKHDLELSRKALGVDCIDLYWLHRDDLNRPVEELLQTLEDFREQGWIRHYGASNFSVARLKEAAELAVARRGWAGFSASQPMACLGGSYRKPMDIPLLEVFDAEGDRYHRECGMPLMPYTAQAVGFYEKFVRLGAEHPLLRDHPFNTLRCRRIAKQLMMLSKQTGHTVSALVLAWWRSKPYPVYPLIGCRTPDQLEASLLANEVTADVVKLISGVDEHA